MGTETSYLLTGLKECRWYTPVYKKKHVQDKYKPRKNTFLPSSFVNILLNARILVLCSARHFHPSTSYFSEATAKHPKKINDRHIWEGSNFTIKQTISCKHLRLWWLLTNTCICIWPRTYMFLHVSCMPYTTHNSIRGGCNINEPQLLIIKYTMLNVRDNQAALHHTFYCT